MKFRVFRGFHSPSSSPAPSPTQTAPDAFLVKVLEAGNLKRAKRLGEELAAMPETLIADLADYRELMVSVRNDSTIRVKKMVYSVPCRLIGVKLLAARNLLVAGGR